jgi:tRNA A37 threonylcarbamoyladenosine biosynthesis protein TsaE
MSIYTGVLIAYSVAIRNTTLFMLQKKLTAGKSTLSAALVKAGFSGAVAQVYLDIMYVF